MDTKAQIITNRLSLRQPQVDSLEILEKLVETLELKKDIDVLAELEKVKNLYPTCSDFERDFPSVCFALATGVGKTRLMGAFISYLYTAKGIRNFFVLAPNLTVYNKLIDDFSNQQSPKYVFKGIAEFAVTPPRIITGDNYAEAKQSGLFAESVKINIFNISKINLEMRGDREPKIKRLSEYLGESYFNYLAELPDLVLLMDESHHYRANAGMRAINELKPILGLELTATPKYSSGARHEIKFKNVVFEYSLAAAMRDGFVKEPTVATRKNFNPLQYRNDEKELELIKLEDGIRFHEDTKTALELYALNNEERLVRPFVLVVTKDTDHAKEVRSILESDKFFDGKYKGKVIEVHSKQTGEESDENIAKLLNLEQPDNTVEIVVHVNMLKEGWDVTNLYTIIPLRVANAEILVEQTIGRGLRLPYGRRTGDKKADTLTVIAHDRFQAIIDAANKPDSIIKRENIIEIDPENIPIGQQVITAPSILEAEIWKERRHIESIQNPAEQEKANIALEAREMILGASQAVSNHLKNITELSEGTTRKTLVEEVVKHIDSMPQQFPFREEIIETVENDYDVIVSDLIEKTIPIPRIVIRQTGSVQISFEDFDLDTAHLNFKPVTDDLIRRSLRTNENEVINTGAEENIIRDVPVNIIVRELTNYPSIEYDKHAVLLYKLAGQAIKKLSEGAGDRDLNNIVLYHKREIAGFIWAQMEAHFSIVASDFDAPIIYPYTKIEHHNYIKLAADPVYALTDTISPVRDIPNKIFGGFKKAGHTLYKFDSKAEKDFALILEQDGNVLRWLRPALAQFSLYWDHNSRRYLPDFVAETAEAIYLIEIKAETQINDAEVVEKGNAAKKYCEMVTSFNMQNGGKPWTYILISHNVVAQNMTLESFFQKNS